jgi:DNA-binding MarR family transcriptional regulator
MPTSRPSSRRKPAPGGAAANISKANEHAYAFVDQVGHLLRKAYQRHAAIFQQTIPDSQLTAAQFVALCAIDERGGCSMSEIVKATAIDQATVRGIVDRLKARGLVAVTHDDTDRRKVVVRLTEPGSILLDRTIPYAQQITEMTLAGLNAAERVAIVYLLRKMSDGPGPNAMPHKPVPGR